MKSSDVDDVLVPGKPDASRLFLLASHADEPVMPPEDNDVQAKRFDAMELALLKRWIEQGALYDSDARSVDMPSIQPLPPTVKTVYASTLTDDANLSAVAFGNRIELFTRNSASPLESLTRIVDNEPQPAHDDFVQAMDFSPDGKMLVSSGYRNVRIWRRQSWQSESIPTIDASEVLATAVNRGGTHVATLSPRGEIAVAAIGKERWDWMKGFDLSVSATAAEVDALALAVSPSGQVAAIGSGESIRIARGDSAVVQTLSCPSTVTTIALADDTVLYSGHDSGIVMRHQRVDDDWTSTELATEASPVSHLVIAAEANAIVGVNDAGKVWRIDSASDSFEAVGTLPAPAGGVAITAGDSPVLWVVTNAGVLGTFDLAAKKFQEVAKADPVADQQLRRDQWLTLVAQRVQSATEAELKATEANVKAEQESLDKIDKDIEAREKSVVETQAALKTAQQQSTEKAKALADAKAKQESSTEQRGKLAESIKQLAASIEKSEEAVDELNQQKQDAEAELAALPDEKALAETVKKAIEESEKAAAETKKKQSELDALNESVTSAKASKQRAQERLDSLNQEIETPKQNVEKSKADVTASQEREKASKALVDQAKTASGKPLVIDGGKFVITRNGSTEGWSLWAADGTYLGAMQIDGEIIAAHATTLLCRLKNQMLVARRVPERLWKLDGQIGSVAGDSPFADRVLCVTIDPSGRYLATGGGLPSRTGELMLWDLADGTLVRRFEKPHNDTVLSVRFSPDGKTLASGGADRMVHLWDVATGERQVTLEGHTHHVTAVAWGLDGREAASAAADGAVKVWDLKTGKASRTISDIQSEVTRLVYLGSDGRIAITSGDGHLSVYRTTDGQRETHTKIPAGYLYSLSRNRDGTELIVGGSDGVAIRVDKVGKTLQSYGSKP